MKHGLVVGVIAAAALLGGCSQFERNVLPETAVTDDDAICRKAGETGSPAYVACRRDRDVAAAHASSTNAGLERAHKGLADQMLSGQ
ncbi:MAG: hypothetical protein K2W78_02515 [Xanthobacteraceae bacterium]|nr:hypothetical protein [Xanthobacteraceae bacterium]